MPAPSNDLIPTLLLVLCNGAGSSQANASFTRFLSQDTLTVAGYCSESGWCAVLTVTGLPGASSKRKPTSARETRAATLPSAHRRNEVMFARPSRLRLFHLWMHWMFNIVTETEVPGGGARPCT